MTDANENMAARAAYQQSLIYKRYADTLYDFSVTHVLEWPSLTVDWLPDRKTCEHGQDFSLQYVITGTQAAPRAQNFIQVTEVAMPVDTTGMEDYFGGEDGAQAEMTFADVKGFNRIDQVVMTDSEVLKVQAMPQSSDIVACFLMNGTVAVYHLGRRPKFSDSEQGLHPDLSLRGHRRPGFALDWNPSEAGLLASGGDDQMLIIWDIEDYIDECGNGSVDNISAKRVYKGHGDTVQDVSWHGTQYHVLASASEDSCVRLWDTRAERDYQCIQEAHPGGAYCVSFHPLASFQFASGGADNTIKLWDIRKPFRPLHELVYHTGPVYGVEWSPFSDTVLASTSADRRAVVWDLSRMGQPHNSNGDANAPPELSFVHLGHMSRVTAAAWNPSMADEWLIASTDETNALQIWRPESSVVDNSPPDPFEDD